MFEDSLLQSSSGKMPARRGVAVSLATAIELALVGLLVLFPLMHVSALPESMKPIESIPFSPPGPPPASGVVARHPMAHPVTLAELEQLPVKVPDTIRRFVDKAQSIASAAPGTFPGSSEGVPGGLGPSGLASNWTAVPAPPPQATGPKKPMRISEGIQAARLIYAPQPVYPQIARRARIQGTVRLDAIIDQQGTIRALKVVQGNPLLVQAALNAVSQWCYRPTLLNGKAVEVESEIDVIFTLGE